MDLTVRCTCGTLQGTITGTTPRSVCVTICDCRWCQWYAQALGREGDVLDDHGGTTVLMVSPARLTFTAGQDQLVCGTMTAKGPKRWYAACCKTPLANTISPAVPFLGVLASCIAEQPIEAHVGPALARINSSLTGADARTHRATRLPQARMMARLGALMAAWWLQGAHKKMPFPDVAPHRLARPDKDSAGATHGE